MRYISTRGEDTGAEFEDVMLAGLARDGGLYVPGEWPSAAGIEAMSELDYAELAARLMQPFVAEAFGDREFAQICRQTYNGKVFDDPAITPLSQIEPGLWLLELYHGPTLAFKDIALQLLGRLFDTVLERRGEHLTIIGATSGDTGSAAIEACRGRDNLDIFMLHPKGRISAVQRRLMTTVDADNVHNIAVEGDFDDCQALVKAMFNDLEFRDRYRLSAVNSINWARVMAQCVYYFHATLKLGKAEDGVAFAVPTGNFGDVFAGYVAARMGLAVRTLIVATNENDILHRALSRGDYSRKSVTATSSPAMDIQVSSNFERLLFDLYDRDSALLAEKMAGFQERGELLIEADRLKRLKTLFSSTRIGQESVEHEIRGIYENSGALIDPHSAVGVAAARNHGFSDGAPVVALATAHPAKFPDVVESVTGKRPSLPDHLSDLFEREEKCTSLPNDLPRIQEYVKKCVRDR